MSKSKHPSISAFLIATFVVVIFSFAPIIQWSIMYGDFIAGQHYFYRLLLKAFNFWDSELATLNGLRFFLTALLICYLTKLFLLKPRELPRLFILLAVIASFISFTDGTSFFKFSSLCSILLVGLALFSKRRGSSIILMALAIMVNFFVALPLGVILCAADQYRQFKYIYRSRFLLVMIDSSILAALLFLTTATLAY